MLDVRLLLAALLAGCSYHREITAQEVLVAVLVVGLTLRSARGGLRRSVGPSETPQVDDFPSHPRRPPEATPLLCDPCEEFLVVRERLRRGEITEHEALELLEGRHAAY